MTATDYMARAMRALASAKLLLHDGDRNGAVNRAYYAMFDAAHAALFLTDNPGDPGTPKTHAGLIAKFGLCLVKPGIFSPELGRTLNQVERIRLLADYTGEEIDKDAAQRVILQADSFVAAVNHKLSSIE